MRDFIKFTIRTTPFKPEEISEAIWALDVDGVTENDDNLEVFVRPDSNENIKTIAELLNSLALQDIFHSFDIDEDFVADRNWNEEFEKKINVVEISDRLVIKPSFKEYQEKPGQLIIHIDPKMSFGTGEHQTTKLVLQLLEKYVKGNEEVLDVGSGTGILAIAAVKLGAKNAIGVDNDEWCLLNGKENTALNKVEDTVEVVLGELKDIKKEKFDLVVANINKHILLDIINDLKNKVLRPGTLILSGLLDVDETDILKVYADDKFKLVEKVQLAEWIALVFKAE